MQMLKLLKAGEAKMVTKGSVYNKKGGRQTLSYAFFYTVAGGERKRKVVTGNSEEELVRKAQGFLEEKDREYLEKLEAERRDAEWEERPRTLEEAGEEWYGEYCQSDVTYSSKASRGCSLKALCKAAGGVPVQEIDTQKAQEIVKGCSVREDGGYFSRSHVDKLQQVLFMVMEYAAGKGYCTEIPKKGPLDRNLTEPNPDDRFLDRERIREIFDAVQDNPRYRVFLRLLFATGLRQEEAFALNEKDFRIMKDGNVEVNIHKVVREVEKNRFIIVEGAKTKRSIRRVYIPYGIYEEVMEYHRDCTGRETEEQARLREENGTVGTIFVNSKMQPVNKRTFQHNYEKYLRKRGISYKINLHMYRHSFVSIQSEKMSLDKIAKIIGDSIATAGGIYQSLTSATKTAVCENTMELFNSL